MLFDFQPRRKMGHQRQSCEINYRLWRSYRTGTEVISKDFDKEMDGYMQESIYSRSSCSIYNTEPLAPREYVNGALITLR